MCNIIKNDTQMVLSIISKFGPTYSVFVYALHYTRLALGASFNMPSLNVFVSSLLQEIDNLSKMDIQNTLRAHALAANGGNKGARKKNPPHNGEK